MDHIPKILLGVITAMILFYGAAHNSTAGEVMEGPDSVDLDSLAELYGPVTFDHAMHTEAAEGKCAACHHHSTGTPVEDPLCVRCHATSGATDSVACQECHVAKRFEADYIQRLGEDKNLYHADKVGLKAAYHLRCMGCHEESGAPTGCQDCHTRNDAGDKFFHAGNYAPPPEARGTNKGH